MAAEDYFDPYGEPDDDAWTEEGRHETCNRCGGDIFLAIDPEDGKWKPYESETSNNLHRCKKPATNFFAKID